MSESQKAEPQGRPVRFSDDELVEMVHAAVLGDGIRSAGAAEKAFRAAGKGSNGKRIRRRGRWPSGTCPMSRRCSRSTPPRWPRAGAKAAAEAEQAEATEPVAESVAKAEAAERVKARRGRKSAA